jgi:hypothetical protein
MNLNKYKALIKVPSSGGTTTVTVWVTLDAKDYISAKLQLEALYGRGNIKQGPSLSR